MGHQVRHALVPCLSCLAQALLIGCTLFYIRGIGYLPIATLDGLFIYMGMASLPGNSFFQRIILFITDTERRDARSLDFLQKVAAARGLVMSERPNSTDRHLPAGSYQCGAQVHRFSDCNRRGHLRDHTLFLCGCTIPHLHSCSHSIAQDIAAQIVWQ